MEGWRWRIGDLDSSLRNLVVVLSIMGIYLQSLSIGKKKLTKSEKSSRCTSTYPLVTPGHGCCYNLPKSRSVVDSGKRHNVVIGWSRAPVGIKERSRNQEDVEKATTERMKRRGLGEPWRREESARKKQKIERRHKVEESEMRRERRTKMKMDGT